MTQPSPDRADTTDCQLELDSVRMRYPGRAAPVLDDLQLRLRKGQIACLLGASGCGKTSVLRAIAGFEPIDAGSIRLAGRALTGPPESRRIGMMFQDYALFPHLSVAANIGFGLRALAPAARRAQVEGLLNMVGLGDYGSNYPHELSGGQQQRVALARALAQQPDLVLLDEPFSNLDRDQRARLLVQTRDLLQARGATALMVTHDQTEAFAIADVIGVMAQGRILQWDRPEQLHRRPADRRVAACVCPGDWVRGDSLGLSPALDVRLRPGQLLLQQGGPIRATVLRRWYQGPAYIARLQFANGDSTDIELSAEQQASATDEVALALQCSQDELLSFTRPG